MKNNILLLCYFIFSCLFTAKAQINWQHTNGPEGGAFFTIWSDSTHAYLTNNLQLFRTGDGMHWESLPNGYLWPMDASPEKLAAGRGNSNGNVVDYKLVVSYDKGTTWIEGSLPPNYNLYFSDIAVCTHGIYIPDGVSGKVYVTQDDGLVWDSILAPEPFIYDVHAFDDKLFVSTLKKVWQLAPNGIDWILVSPVFDQGDYLSNMFAVDSLLFFATEDHLWTSSNNGNTWTKTPASSPLDWSQFAKVGSRIYKMAGEKLVYTDDFGHTWLEYPFSETPVNIVNLATAGGHLLGITWNFGNYRLDEIAQKFVPANDGLNSAPTNALGKSGDLLWAACSNGAFAYDLTQQMWVDKAELPIQVYSQMALSQAGKVAMTREYGRYIFVTENNGISWDTVLPIPPFSQFGQITYLYWINEKLCLKDDLAGFYCTSDLGQTWEPGIPIKDVVAFQGKHYAVHLPNHLYVSSNNGNTWQPVTTIPALNVQLVFATADRLFAVTKGPQWNYTLYSSLDGVNWTYANDGLPKLAWEGDLEWIESYLGNVWQVGDQYFLHHYSGQLFTSLDSCKVWLPVGANAGNSLVFVDSLCYIGTYSGVLKADIPQNYSALSDGVVYSDLNDNGQRDPGEEPLPGLRVSISEPGAWFPHWFVHTQSDGSYYIGHTPQIEDTLRVELNSPWVQSIHPPYYLVTETGANRDFGVHLTPNVTDVSIQGNVAGRPRPGFALNHVIQFQNEGTVMANGIVSVKLDPQLLNASAFPAPTSVIGTDSLVWDFSQLAPFNDSSILVFGDLSQAAPLGSAYTLRAHIIPDITDQNAINNHLTITDTIVGSYDPNEKRVEPARGLTAEEIAAGKELLYTIHFQNTGTFQADRVRITDHLDSALNASTLRFVTSSHAITQFQLLPGNLIEVVFDHINLPDSNANEPASHGFVTFAIQRKKAFNPAYVVRNTAAIYFDFNEPIITNTVNTPLYIPETVSTTEPTHGAGFSTLHIFPNPASTEFNLFTRGTLSGTGQINLFNSEGKPFQTMQVPDTSVPVTMPVKNVPPGMYFIQIKDVKAQMWGKILIKR